MMIEIGYRRENVLNYASKWALGRNPVYLDFHDFGGDCTNFASQCVFAGCHVMNDTKTFGWYYHSPTDRAPAWTSVESLHKFLTANEKAGPYGREIELEHIRIGDLIQLGDADGHFYHTLVVCSVTSAVPLICAHTDDAHMRPLDSYSYARARAIQIQGARQYL